MRIRLLTAVLLVFALSACYSAKPPAESPAGIPPPEIGLAPSIFPHKADWKDPAQHGVYVKNVLDFNTASCLACHKDTDVVSGGAPSCYSCHKLFPHTEPGVTLATHSDYVLKNGKAACATQCHGTDLKGGLSGVSCTKCHNSYPHDPGWSAPGVHGPAAKGDLKTTNQCNLCHSDDWKGGSSKVSCLNCHKGIYPHSTGWASPDQHGAFASTNGTGKCATQCHGVQLDGGLSGVSCKEGCHKVWPHPAQGWMVVHGQTARSIGINGCTGCHTDDAAGGTTGVSCTQCHAALTAHQGTDWPKGGHGQWVTQQPTSLTDAKGCTLCHGATLEGGKVPTLAGLKPLPGCKDCHASYPSLHKSAVGAPAWNIYGGHGKWVLNQVDVSKGGVLDQINALITDCKLCHGSDLKGGTSGKSCYTCHTTFPHNIITAATPWLSIHGGISNFENPKAASCATANCHGQKLEGSSFNGKKLVMACNECHLQMPHQATWPKTHGASAATNITACTTCHGADLKGKGTSPSCYQCHDNFPIHHRNADGTKSTQWKPATGTDFHGALVKAASGTTTKDKSKTLKCTTCHDSDNAGNPSPSCYSCHASFPHAAKSFTVAATTYSFVDNLWGGFTNGHGQYVVVRAKLNNVSATQQIQAECATTCHGSDLLGGTSQKSCTNCHSSYPHVAGWVKAYDPTDTKTPGGEHGLYVLKNGTGGCLTGCHGTDGSGGNSGKACTSCHNYPHKTDWKVGANSPEYPPHALAVLNTQNTVTKNDDTFNDVNFGECAKCHGPVLDYVKNETYPFPEGDKTLVTVDTGITVKRCTSCHIYPHQKGQGAYYNWYEWKKAHGVPLLYWTISPGFSAPNDTCGSAEGQVGCHTSGPTITVPGKEVIKEIDGCNFCHK